MLPADLRLQLASGSEGGSLQELEGILVHMSHFHRGGDGDVGKLDGFPRSLGTGQLPPGPHLAPLRADAFLGRTGFRGHCDLRSL